MVRCLVLVQHSLVWRLAIGLLLACLGNPSRAFAQEPVVEGTSHCLQLIRQCQLPDGAFRMKADGDPIWVRPYFGNFAALALLAGKNDDDLPRVEAWLQWYADKQLADGTINDWEGTVSEGYNDNGQRDSVDSYAATYLLVVDRFHRTAKPSPSRFHASAKLAFDAITLVWDDDLTWAKPDYRIKYLQDNVEVYGSLVAAERLFNEMGDVAIAQRAKQMREALGRKLSTFWQESERRFAYAKRQDNAFVIFPGNATQNRETTCMANLAGLAWISSQDKSPWNDLIKEFSPDRGDAPQSPIERWYMAAVHAGTPDEARQWRERLVVETSTFRLTNVYIHRPAISALALLEGTDWLPGIHTQQD